MSDVGEENRKPYLSGIDSNEKEQTVDFESRGSKITNYLKSQSTLEALQDFQDESRGKVIGLIIEYFTLFSDGFGIEEFVNSLEDTDIEDNRVVSRILTDSLIKKIGFHSNLALDEQRTIYDIYLRRVFTNGFYYHGFNGVFEQSIRSEGLSTENRLWNWDELKEIVEIIKKRGHAMLFGWGLINSEKQIAYASTPRDSYRYAVASPEWFGQFVSEGFHIENDPKKKEAYYRNDYETAKQNITTLCEEWQSSKEEDIATGKSYPNITDTERNQIMEFFEKYWHLFRGKDYKPMLALIKREAIDSDLPLDFETNMKLLGQSQKRETDIYELINSLRQRNQMIVDAKTNINISPEDIDFVELPDYQQVFPQIT
jgi:hypothetical protein